MKYTNKHNLPQPVADAISRDTYIRGDNNYSVTELIESPRVVQLKRRYWDELEEDVIDSVWSIFGSAVHNIMEAHASDADFVEQRYYIELFNRKVGGMVDCYNSGTITDYKVTSAWSIVYGSRAEHWAQQLNLYAHIMRHNGFNVEKLQIVAFLRDWDKNKAKADSTYPQIPLLVMPIPVWEPAVCEAYLSTRLAAHMAMEDVSDDELVACSAEECWEQPTKYAIMKKDAKRATKLFESLEDAEAYLTDVGGYEIVIRKGRRTRCAEYCSLAIHCSQWRAYQDEQTQGE